MKILKTEHDYDPRLTLEYRRACAKADNIANAILTGFILGSAILFFIAQYFYPAHL